MSDNSDLTSHSQEKESQGSDSACAKLCYCGESYGHQWAPTSQCEPPTSYSSQSSLFSQISVQSDQPDSDYQRSSSCSWGISRLPPSLVKEINSYTEKRTGIISECDGNCPTARRLREENDALKEDIIELHLALNKVPGYPDYFNIVYEGDISVYVYRLLEDYKAGDIRVLVQ